MKKFCIYLLSVVIGTLVCDWIFTISLEKLMPKATVSKLFDYDKTCTDILILGASRAFVHYNPEIISEGLNRPCSVYGKSGQNIYFQYAVLDALLEQSKEKPNVVLYEISPNDIISVSGSNTERLNELYPFYYSENAVKDILSKVLDKKELIIVKASGLYRFNSKLIIYIGQAIKGTTKPMISGYAPENKVWNKPIEEINVGNIIDEGKISFLVKFITKCKQENIKLVFMNSPRYNLFSHKLIWKDKLKEIASEYEIPFIDYEEDSVFHSHPEWFYDPGHLNKTGSTIYSKILSNRLKMLDL